ncbi:MAG: Ldh family oxidoreductase, partial [Rhodospirillales bacterium]
VAAYGKVKTAAQQGQEMPVGWMITKDGEPLIDPTRADEGFLLPIGGPKGSGLSLVFGLLAGVLNGAAFGRDVVDFNADFQTATNTGQFIVAIDIAAFGDANSFKRRVDDAIRAIKSSPTLPGFEEVLLPGENSFRKREDYQVNGIPLSNALHEGLDNLAENLGIKNISY